MGTIISTNEIAPVCSERTQHTNKCLQVFRVYVINSLHHLQDISSARPMASAHRHRGIELDHRLRYFGQNGGLSVAVLIPRLEITTNQSNMTIVDLSRRPLFFHQNVEITL